MKIFVLGFTHSGKSPLCARLAAASGWPRYSTGGYARAYAYEKLQANPLVLPDLTECTVELLRQRPDAGLSHLAGLIDPSLPAIIDGERNPFDFIHLFSPHTDVAVSLTNAGEAWTRGAFDRGINVIGGYLDWLQEMTLIEPVQNQRVTFDTLYEEDRQGPDDRCLESLIPELARRIVADFSELNRGRLPVSDGAAG